MSKNYLKNRPIIISAWICAGKTYLTQKYDNVTELASGDYKYILTEEQKAVVNKESLKSTERQINPQWPYNYYDAILAEATSGKHDIILIAPCMPFEEMRNYGIDFVLAYPVPECKDEYKKRAKQRGANDAFISRVEKKITDDYEEFLNQPNEKITLQPGEYLEDALIRMGILNP